MANEVISVLTRDLITLDDETNPEGSGINTIYPSTTLDQVFDNRSSTNKTLRTIIEELKVDILTGGRGNINFPVTSVNGKTGNIEISPADLGLQDLIGNKPDMDKPLSDPQREAVSQMISSYRYEVDLSDLYNHINDMDNPHGVTIAQLDSSGAVTSMIKALIHSHSIDTDMNTHLDIRNQISALSSRLSNLSTAVDQTVTTTFDTIARHDTDTAAHINLFSKKEDADNKAYEIGEGNHKSYPSTRAVVEYVTARLAEYKRSNPDVQQWIDDIIFIDNRSELPMANYGVYRKAYFIRYGNGSHPELAICRMNPDGRTYGWDISTSSTFSKFDPVYFTENADGLSINLNTITDRIMQEDSILNSMKSQLSNLMPNIMGEYYTKTAIDTFHFIRSISILPGTQDGTIRYFINEDERTMSDDIRVTGLQRLAFLEWITEGELADQAVQSRHIVDRAIEHRHMGDKAVSYKNMQASHMTMFGNLEDETNHSVQEITIPELAATLNPYLQLQIDDTRFSVLTDPEIYSIMNKAFRSSQGWVDPELCVNAYVSREGELIIEYDYDDPIIWMEPDGTVYMMWDNTATDNALVRFKFRIDGENLVIDYTELDPTKPAEFKIMDDELIVEYSEMFNAPQISHDAEGNIILTSYDSEVDVELSKYFFMETSNGDLIMFYDMPDFSDKVAKFDFLGEDLIVTYDEAYGQPEIWLDRTTGDLILNSYDSENDVELSRYIFKINLEGELEATYLD